MQYKVPLLLLLLFSFLTHFTLGQDKQPLQLKDYDQWSRIISSNLSPNGEWFVYIMSPNGGDDTLHIKSIKSGEISRVPYASNPVISDKGNFLAYYTQPGKEASKKLKKDKKEIHQTAHLKALGKDEAFHVERAGRMAFNQAGTHWAVQRKKPESDKSKHKGTDLVLYETGKAQAITLGNVSEFSFNKRGDMLAYLVDADEQLGNGVFLLDLKSMVTINLDADAMSYQQLTWDDEQSKKSDWNTKGRQLSVLKGKKADSLTHQVNQLLVFTDLGAGRAQYKLDMEHKDFPSGMVISENTRPYFSENGKAIWLGIRAQEDQIPMSKDTLANVDVWHWKDDYIQSVQMVRAERERKFTYAGVFHLNEDKFVRLADEDLKNLLPSKHPVYSVGRNEKPYLSDVNWGISPADLYRVNVNTGERKRFETLVNRTLDYSPDGRYYLYQKDSALYLYDLEQDRKTNISAMADVSFMNMEHPYPHEKPPFGIAGWTKDKKHVLVNHQYDLWMLSLDGKQATNITKTGTDAEIRFRYFAPDKEEEWIDTAKPLMLSAFGEKSKKSGYYELRIGREPQALLFEDAMIGTPTKALDSEKFVYTKQTFEAFPDYYLSDSRFRSPVRLTDANPQQANFAWGRRILVEYENSKGKKLQGTLALPAGYEAGKSYPTIIYFYEKMSDRHHQYSMPVYDDRPHMSTYASNGYMVFMPDLEFEEGRPGTSSLDCITSAARELIDQGYADPERIGLQGHSWSGYQTSFILTQTDMFRCIVTGAPPTNLESFYNNIYGSTGTVHHGIMEIGQVRMGAGVTPWTHRDAYNRENPMYHIPNIQTPFLILHGTKDGAVDWSQGLELYNAARRMGKEVIFLSYPDEGHHLSNEANQKDFQERMKDYFDHYLMETPAPEWMVGGVPHLQKLYDKGE